MALHQSRWDQFSRGRPAFAGLERGSVVMAISLPWLVAMNRSQDATVRQPRDPLPRSSEPEILLDSNQLAFRGDHPIIEGDHGSFLRFGGGAVQAFDLQMKRIDPFRRWPMASMRCRRSLRVQEDAGQSAAGSASWERVAPRDSALVFVFMEVLRLVTFRRGLREAGAPGALAARSIVRGKAALADGVLFAQVSASTRLAGLLVVFALAEFFRDPAALE